MQINIEMYENNNKMIRRESLIFSHIFPFTIVRYILFIPFLIILLSMIVYEY